MATINHNNAQPEMRVHYQPKFEWSFLKPNQWGVWLLLLIIFICTLLPRRVALKVGSGIGLILYKVNKKRRDIAYTNLKLCFPNMSEAERHQLRLDSYKSYGQNIIDLGHIWWSPVWRIKRTTKFSGIEHFNAAIEAKRPILLLTPHASGMDQCGILLSSLHPSVSMMKSLKNPVLDWIITRGRLRFKGKILLREMGIRHLVRAMKTGASCFYIPDEDLGPDNSIFVPFFGVESATIPMLGRMAKLSNAVVIPTMAEICANGNHMIHMLEPLKNFPSGDDYKDTLAMNQALEKLIMISPKQYMWTLKWFKTRPNGEPAPYLK